MTMMRILGKYGLAVIVSLCFSAISTAQPQAPAQPAPAPPDSGQVQPEAPQAKFTESQLQSFIDIQGDLEVIRTEYGARLEGIDDPEVAQTLQEEAGREMVAAVEARNLDVEVYNEIARALQQDPELLARVQEMMDQG